MARGKPDRDFDIEPTEQVMHIGYEPFFIVFVISLLIYHFYKPIARRREIRRAWQTIANEMGWICAEYKGHVAGTLQGIWLDRSFELKA